jgi:DNA-binding transcriptional MerR regulator
MFRRNNRRIELICKLRSQGLTIDQIDNTLKKQGENFPRSSIGYYVKNYCSHIDEKYVKTNRVAKKRKPQAQSIYPFGNVLSGTLPLSLPPQTIRRKSRTMDEIIEKEKRTKELGESLTIDLLDLFEKNPHILAKRLDVLVKIVFLASYLRINVEEIIDEVCLILLGRPKKQTSAHNSEDNREHAPGRV